MTIIRTAGLGLLGALALAGAGCDRLKEAAEGVRRGGGGAAGGGGAVDAGLQAHVDLDRQGYRFRHDLAFPGRVRCTVSTTTSLRQARRLVRSALGGERSAFDVTTEHVVVAERDGGVVSVRVERARARKPLLEGDGRRGGKGKGDEGDEALGIEGVAARFVHRDDGWRRRGGGGEDDFKGAAWAAGVAGVLDDLVQEWALVPRSPWLGGMRLLPGAEVTLRDEQLCLVAGPGVTRGEVTLRFEGVTAVDGHPCGTFAWRGSLGGRQAGLAGERWDVEASVDEGRLWCSLVYPVVLRSECKGTVTKVAREADGALRERIQGALEETVTRRWEPLP